VPSQRGGTQLALPDAAQILSNRLEPPTRRIGQAPSNSLSRTFIACSFGLLPPLSSHASILLRRTSCEVAGAFTVTVSRVAGPGAFAVNPHRRNSPIASVAASYSELASTACRMIRDTNSATSVI